MNNKNKILMRILLVILTLTLISTLVLSSVYARYVKRYDNSAKTARPAGLSFDVQFSNDRNLQASFALDGYPGNPIGYSRNEKYYDFKVQSCDSEVALDVSVKVNFNQFVAQKIRDNRANIYTDGVLCDYELQIQNATTKEYESIKNNQNGYTIVETSLEPSDSGAANSVITVTVPAKKNADGTTSGFANYRLVIKTMNNTLMPSGGNSVDYFLSTDSISLNVSATQHDPGFSGIIP